MAIINGTSGDDTLNGTNNDDTINGFAGTDTINGGAGNDTINPGDNAGGTRDRHGFEGFDWLIGSTGNDQYIFTDSLIGFQGLSYQSSGLSSGITVTINGTTNTGSVDKGIDGTDTLTDIATTLGSSFPNNPFGGFGVYGTNMNDVFNITNNATTGPSDPNGQWMSILGGDGVDTYNITSGVVRIDFRGGTQSVNVDLSTGTVSNDGYGNAETITGDVWEVRGGDNSDTLVGSNNDESFIGELGNDTIDGGGGFDRLRFDRNNVERVLVDLSAGSAKGIWNGHLFEYTISNIEFVRGSLQGSDVLIGDAMDNKLVGFGGSDVLEGGGGNDELYGEHDESGAVIVNGQSDAFVFTGSFGNDTIMDFAANDIIRFDSTVHGTPIVAAQGADVLISFTGLTETVLVKNASVSDVNNAIEIVTPGIVTTGDGNVDMITGISSAGTSGPADGTADGTITVSGGRYTGTNAAEQIQVGTTSDGIVTINSGAVVEVDAAINGNFPFSPGGVPSGTYGNIYNAVQAGRDAGSSGIINVDGVGSRLYVGGAPGGMRIGNNGEGTLNITNGGTVETSFLDVAREGTSVGTVNIDGASSSLLMHTLGGVSPNYAGEAAFGRIGRESGSKGYLNITNGGKLEMVNEDGVTDNPAFQIARNDGSYGKAIVDGAGSEWNITQVGPNGDSYGAFTNLTIGRNGQGILEIKNNGAVNVTGDRAAVSVSTAFNADAVIDPASRLEVTTGGQLYIQSSTGGTPIAGSPGQYANGPRFRAGDNANSLSTVIVDGMGSSIDVIGAFGYSTIGREGSATLTVRNGGEFNMDGNAANLAVGQGDGTGPQVSQSSVMIESGGKINITSSGNDNGAFVNLGRLSDGNGYISVDGAGSQLNITSNNTGVNPDQSAFMNVGREGVGELRITNGGEVNITGGVNDEYPGMNVGRNAGSNGTVVVDGAGSELNITGGNSAIGGGGGFIAVGREGTGYMTAQNGGVIQNDVSDGTLFVGRKSGADGTIKADGAGSLIDGGLLTIIGADFNFSANDISAVDFINTGTGVARAVDGGTIRSDEFFVGNGGTLEGNGTFDGNVTMNGDDSGSSVATLFPGTAGDPGATLNITGNLNMMYGGMNMEIFSTTPADNDIINVGGIANISGGSIDISFRNGFTPMTGNSFTLVSATDLTFDATNVEINLFNGIADQALVIADTGSDLVFSALNNGGGAAGILDFGAGSASGVQAQIEDGTGTSTGGAFDSAGFINITQFLGTNMNDTFDGSASTDALNIQALGGNDTIISGAGADILNGGADTDTISYAGSAAAVNVNLGTGSASGGSAQGDSLTNFENLIGSDFDDTLIGNVGANHFDGGAGTDTTSYENSGSAVRVSLAGAGTGGQSQGDTYTSIENVTGSDFNDTLIGDAAANVLSGGDGNDTLLDVNGTANDTLLGGAGNDNLQGGAGADTLDGGADTDEARYTQSDAAVNINLGTGVHSGGHAAGDTLIDIENVAGSQFNDTLIGDGGVNRLDGFAGNDTLQGGLGADILFGGTGQDTADYSDSTVAVDIGHFRIGSGGTAEGDQLLQVEGITGSDFNDTLVGSGIYGLAVLNGGDGDDLLFDYGGASQLNGGAGNDTMVGRLGADAFDGGADTDVVRYADAVGAVNVNLATGVGTGADAQGDTYVNVENVVGSIFFDTLTGDAGVNDIRGGRGRDRITGGEGNDLLYGEDDLDTFVYDTTNWGNDLIFDFDASREFIDVSAIGLTFNDFTVVDTAFGIRLDYNDPTNGFQSIALGGVNVGDIDASNFITTPPAPIMAGIEAPQDGGYRTGDAVEALELPQDGGYQSSDPVETLDLADLGGYQTGNPVASVNLDDIGGYQASDPVETLELADLGGYEASDPVEAMVLDEIANGGGFKTGDAVETMELSDIGGYKPAEPSEPLDDSRPEPSENNFFGSLFNNNARNQHQQDGFTHDQLFELFGFNMGKNDVGYNTSDTFDWSNLNGMSQYQSPDSEEESDFGYMM